MRESVSFVKRVLFIVRVRSVGVEDSLDFRDLILSNGFAFIIVLFPSG